MRVDCVQRRVGAHAPLSYSCRGLARAAQQERRTRKRTAPAKEPKAENARLAAVGSDLCGGQERYKDTKIVDQFKRVLAGKPNLRKTGVLI
eukprot:scaffold1514_cov199-Pinguiococcus_pyrenoidosus.AAC.2